MSTKTYPWGRVHSDAQGPRTVHIAPLGQRMNRRQTFQAKLEVACQLISGSILLVVGVTEARLVSQDSRWIIGSVLAFAIAASLLTATIIRVSKLVHTRHKTVTARTTQLDGITDLYDDLDIIACYIEQKHCDTHAIALLALNGDYRALAAEEWKPLADACRDFDHACAEAWAEQDRHGAFTERSPEDPARLAHIAALNQEKQRVLDELKLHRDGQRVIAAFSELLEQTSSPSNDDKDPT